MGDLALLLEPRVQGLIADIDGVEPSRHLDDGGIAEGLRKLLSVDGRRGDNDVQVGPPGEEAPQDAQDEIDVEAPLVRLVDDDRVVGGKPRIVLGLHEEDPVGHDLEEGIPRGCVVETDLVADRMAEIFAQLFGDPPGDCRRSDPPGLRAADQSRQPAAGLDAHFRDLGGLSGARLAGDDDDLVPPDRIHDGLFPLKNRQGLGVDDAGQMPASLRDVILYSSRV